MTSPNQLVLIDCPDRTGLVHAVSGVLFRQGLNIVRNQEFVDRDARHFFMRTECAGALDQAQVNAELTRVLPAEACVRIAALEPKRIVVFAGKEPYCLGELLLRHSYGDLHAGIAAVISNHADLEDLVRRFGLPFECVPQTGLEHAEHEARLRPLLERYAPEYLVLAKYMRILTPEFVARWPRRIVNIHHSFLPAFAGANPYGQAFRRGVKIIGATAHFVTDALDEGPIIAQDVTHVDHTFSAAAMAQAGRDVEKLVLAKALRLVFEERLFVHGNRTIVFD
ncbi:MAG: formyltetrahydrofolate deformylase [Planctomycetes bacterium]|nr:formyltetrahydrofolate deformylase [Planctomycetota bacterium]